MPNKRTRDENDLDNQSTKRQCIKDLTQKNLLKRINTYLRYNDRRLPETDDEKFQPRQRMPLIGYCHGLCLLWLYKMAEGKQDWFYQTVKKIVTCKKANINDLSVEIEKLLAHIEWCQRPMIYTHGGDEKDILNQRSLDKILEVKKVFSETDDYNEPRLVNLIYRQIKQANMICISSMTDHRHSVALYYDRNSKQFSYYDPNFESGQAIILNDLRDLMIELNNSFYTKFNLPVPYDFMKLEIDGVEHRPLGKQIIKKLTTPMSFFARKIIVKKVNSSEEKSLAHPSRLI